MRSQSITEIMGRIAVAEIDSPIAVFKNDDGTYRSQFAALGYSKPKGRKYPVSSWTRGIAPMEAIP